MEATARLGLRIPLRRQFICVRCLQKSTTVLGEVGAGARARARASMRYNSIAARQLHGTRTLAESPASQSQAMPLGDFYAELLATPMPKTSEATTSAPLPTFVQSGDATKEERARKLFGSIRGSGYERRTSDTPDETWQKINGVLVPPRPLEPENCCMSGCVNCVWDDYRIDVEEWAMRVREARAKGGSAQDATRAPKVRPKQPAAVEVSSSMDDDGGGSSSLWTMASGEDEGDALFGDIPVGIREFMATEKKIKARKAKKKQKQKDE